jgi:hypothetical protein
VAAGSDVPAAKKPVSLEMPPPPPGVKAKPKADKPIRVALLDMVASKEIPERPLAALNAALAPEIRKLEGISAISAAEVRDMLGLERQKQLLGCEEDATSCLAEVAGALDADEMVTTELVLLGETYTLTARRSDMRRGRVLQSQTKKFAKRDGEELLAVVGPLVEALYPERKLKLGKVRGIEEQQIRRLNPPPLPKWVFVGTTVVAGVSALGGAGFGYLSVDSQRQYQGRVTTAVEQGLVVPGSELAAIERQAKDHALRANALYAVAGTAALAAVVEVFFTDWRGDREAWNAQPVLTPGGGGGVSVGAQF